MNFSFGFQFLDFHFLSLIYSIFYSEFSLFLSESRSLLKSYTRKIRIVWIQCLYFPQHKCAKAKLILYKAKKLRNTDNLNEH